MKQWWIVLFIVGASYGNAQAYWGTRLETVNILLPMLGVQAGLQTDKEGFGLGIRVSLSSNLFMSRAALDGYAQIPLDQSGSSLSLGGGLGYWIALVPTAQTSFHLAVGYRTQPDPSQTWYVEVVPNFFSNGIVLTLTFGTDHF